MENKDEERKTKGEETKRRMLDRLGLLCSTEEWP